MSLTQDQFGVLFNNEGESLVIQKSDGDAIWILLSGFLVFFMHAGFSMLEAGSVRHKNAVNIMFKNIGTIGIGGIMYFLTGFAFGYGEDNIDKSSYGFIGTGNFALSDFSENPDHKTFFFQFAFAATAATIVSGAVAGRVHLIGYFIIAAWLTAFAYPVVTHWVWASDAWLTSFREEKEFGLFDTENGCGMIDFAGSGVVHMTGGIAALITAYILGPRIGRFADDGSPVPIPPHNVSLQTLGVFILWFGWYGFNCGSTLLFDGKLAGKVAVTTTLSPCAAIVTAIFVSKFTSGHFDLGLVLNSALAGLVSITAPCPVVPDWAAVIIGAIGCLIYIGSSKLMLKIKVDDPVDAIAVHGFCGMWGVMAVAIFFEKDAYDYAYSTCTRQPRGTQFAIQLIGLLSILGWVIATVTPVVVLLKVVKLLRVSAEEEETGLDKSEHGGSSVFIGAEQVPSTGISAKVDPEA
mmetsp:Transcript_44004/g.95622  ORF Transcript_44004/g.95622 Transcript_44004/m.95622 type:complete len:464 (+) Transcript_44004:69-1460(+)